MWEGDWLSEEVWWRKGDGVGGSLESRTRAELGHALQSRVGRVKVSWGIYYTCGTILYMLMLNMLHLQRQSNFLIRSLATLLCNSCYAIKCMHACPLYYTNSSAEI